MAEGYQAEIKNTRENIEDLEMKNRLLVDKLNAQIYQQASVYKEKTIGVLQNRCAHNGGVGSPIRTASGMSYPAANPNYLAGANDSAFARSPLGVKRVSNI